MKPNGGVGGVGSGFDSERDFWRCEFIARVLPPGFDRKREGTKTTPMCCRRMRAAAGALVVVWLAPLCLVNNVFAAGVSAHERLGLELLYNATSGASWSLQAGNGWNNIYNRAVDPCVPSAWQGVQCSSTPDRIMWVPQFFSCTVAKPPSHLTRPRKSL